MASTKTTRRSSSRRNAPAAPEEPAERSVAAHVRERQRAVAEREASRLARPEKRKTGTLGHADRKKSAVSSTPFGVYRSFQQPEDAPQEWCGPFSIARQMIAKREEARREEEEQEQENGMHHPLDAAMAELEESKKRKAHPAMQWKGKLQNFSTGSLYSKRKKRVDLLTKGRAVPSLFELTVKFLVDNFEHVESLGNVDNSIRTSIVNQLVANSKLNGQSFAAIAEKGIEALEISDCSDITQAEMATKLCELIPGGLRYLVLDQSGRCFGSKAVQAIIDSAESNKSSCNLFALSIGGAYMLTDTDAARLVVSAARSASSLEFKACPLLGNNLCQSIANSFAAKGTLLELALEDLSLKEDDLRSLISKPDALKNIKSLSLRRIGGLNDDIVTKLIEITGDTLEGLDLSDNHQLSDAVLAGIRMHVAGRLHALTLSGLKQLTSPGLEAFFTFVEGAAPPPMLRTLHLGNCDHEAVTDEVLQLVTQAATQNRDSEQQQISLSGGIVNLNVQGSSLLTDASMEYLAATSARTIEELNVSFCPRITDQGLGYLIDKCNRQLAKIHVWGNAQLTDEFLDGNLRMNDPSLEIIGVWMKKHTSRTIR